ncbi:GIY-YIG nuclease family protein [Gloeothece verrucosa]|uniref:Endonuclease n=1 Tax=Gloeothece verrucosa (strain PCC 7822) TaxID=497965 RepID=E0UNN6_GLOV7|nr:GIY-YIG nuclease family protein [Gloeothece verrucosa]ADN18566.1 endonuclease [Gloeothece verrucosa PCC 7822]
MMNNKVYLLHYKSPIGNLSNPKGQAQHYLGFTTDLETRLTDHQLGKGAKITAAFALKKYRLI